LVKIEEDDDDDDSDEDDDEADVAAASSIGLSSLFDYNNQIPLSCLVFFFS
jgi:hypothetical protein